MPVNGRPSRLTASHEIAALSKAKDPHLVTALELLDRSLEEILIIINNLLGVSNVFGPAGPSHSIGLVPDPGPVAGLNLFLRDDATWASVTSTYDPVTDPFSRALL